jgi:PAS domain S-box-containing protein
MNADPVVGSRARARLLASQRRILDCIAGGAPLHEVLEMLVQLIEDQSEGLRCAILLADSARRQLRFAAAPNIPQDYKTHIEPYLRIAPNMGSCGTAAFLRKPIYTRDAATDRLWEECLDIAARNGLRAIWSTPILSDECDVLGTFAMYYGEPRSPDPAQMELIEMGTQLARVAIEATKASALLRAIFLEAPQALVIGDLQGNIIRLNPAFERLFGHTRDELKGRSIPSLVNERDRAPYQKLMHEVANERRDHFAADTRYRRADGTSVWVHATTSLLRGPAGEALCLVTLVEDVSERRRAEDAARATARKLRALTRRLVDLQEAERRKISHELHDSVGQTLTALRINMDIMRERLSKGGDPLVRERNDDSLELIESAFKAVQDVMYDLRPPMLDDYGLVASLQWYGREYTRRTGVEVDVRDHQVPRLAGDAELALFRIAQEALTNVARHAHASSVAIDISMNGEDVVLAIADDGVGFDREDGRSDRAGYGLTTMRERSEALGGTFAIASEENAGTRIVVTVPGGACGK